MRSVVLSEVKLDCDSDFCNKFNRMSELWSRYKETNEQEDFDAWFDYKFKFETGML